MKTQVMYVVGPVMETPEQRLERAQAALLQRLKTGTSRSGGIYATRGKAEMCAKEFTRTSQQTYDYYTKNPLMAASGATYELVVYEVYEAEVSVDLHHNTGKKDGDDA